LTRGRYIWSGHLHTLGTYGIHKIIPCGPNFFMHTDKTIFFSHPIHSWILNGLFDSCPGKSSIGGWSIHRGADRALTCTNEQEKKKKPLTLMYRTDIDQKPRELRIRIKGQSEWVNHAVARLTGRSWNRRVRGFEVRRIRRAPADRIEGGGIAV
jgi:hypothetical protein